jgi:hypothetical protein
LIVVIQKDPSVMVRGEDILTLLDVNSFNDFMGWGSMNPRAYLPLRWTSPRIKYRFDPSNLAGLELFCVRLQEMRSGSTENLKARRYQGEVTA